jgi:hypothetical protein
MKSPIFWNIRPYSLMEAQQCYSRTYHFQLHGKSKDQEKYSKKQAAGTVNQRVTYRKH